jgi:hypothetical protein
VPNRTTAAAGGNKTATTARELVERTKQLAHKIAEAKASDNGKKKGRKPDPKPADVPRETKTLPVIHADRLAEPANRMATLVGAAAPAGQGGLQAEAVAMQQFNAQFEHFGDDAPACDICGSITVRNGTCYKCFNCGNSMGCS